MVQVTDAARSQIQEILAAQDEKGLVVRLGITGRGRNGFEYELTLLSLTEADPNDARHDMNGFSLLLDAAHLEDLDNVTLDYVEQDGGMGFKIENPNPVWRDALAVRVQETLDREINPGVASHGGHVALLDVRDNRAYIRLSGGCQGCGMADVTLKQGIEVAIKKAVPEIVEVLDSTDHASGTNPYYQPTKGGVSPFG
jgi:Fe/S biogenesis protein NfuA